MKWTSPNQAVVEWDTSTGNSNAGPIHTSFEGYPRYNENVESLPVDEVIKLTVFVDYIVDSFDKGNLPITGIHIIGHADTDDARGRSLEQQISEGRARKVMAYLKKEVEAHARANPRLKAGTPTVATIQWNAPKGVGATDPNPEIAKKGKKAANLSEAERKLNRRVEVVLEPGLNPVEEIPLNLNLPPGWTPPPRQTLPPAPPASQPQKQREWLKDALEKDPIIKALPPFLRQKAIDAGKDLDETAAEKIIDALPIDDTYKPAVQAAVKGLLQVLKGKKFTPPVPQPPQYQQPPSGAPPYQPAPGERIFKLPPFRF